MSDNQKGKDKGKDKRVKRAMARTNVSDLEVTPKRGPGAETLYDEYTVVKVEEAAAKGLNNKEICEVLGIGNKTFYEWRHRYPQIEHALKKYRGLANIEVENALFKSAVGYSVTETKKEARKDPKTGEYKLVVTEEQEKTFAPNTGAAIFYLKNRMPERYKDKVETEISLSQDISSLAFAIKRRE